MPIGAILAIAGTAASLIQKGIAARKAKKAAQKINPQNPVLNVSPEAKEEAGFARQLVNSDVAGGAALERQAATAEANLAGRAARSGLNSGQISAALAMGSKQRTDVLSDLAMRRTQQRLAGAGILSSALRGVTQQRMAVHGDKIRRYEGDQSAKNALTAARQQNISGMFNDVAGLGLSLMGGAGEGVGGELGKLGKAFQVVKGRRAAKSVQKSLAGVF
jgi:hypothetical protein